MTVRARLRAQLLAPPPADSVLGAVERVVGVQAQSWPAARLAVRARTQGLTAADVDHALATGELARTWLMRGTLHLIAAADLTWMTELFGPLNRTAGQRRREELGVADAIAERAVAELPGILSGAGPMDRGELIARLAARGVHIDPSGQAPAHLVAYAAAAGVLCRGPEVGGRPTVILTEDVLAGAVRAGKVRAGEVAAGEVRARDVSAGEVRAARSVGGLRRFSGDAALAELARRYLLGYGPADASDLAAWSGLPMPTARRALSLCTPTPPSSPAHSSSTAAPRLLGQFDTVLLGYRDRGFILSPEHAGRVNAGGGMIASTLLVDGRVAGLWRRAGRKVGLQPFEGSARLSGEARNALEAEVADLSRFLGERLTPAWEGARS